MRLCRFNDSRLGLVRGGEIADVTAALDHLPRHGYPLPGYDPLIAHLDQLRPHIETASRSATKFLVDDVRLLAPVASPGKIVAAPVNYQKHLDEARADPGIHHANQVAEIRKVGLFLKATSSLVGPSQGVAIRFPERRNDHEIELAVVIGQWADRVPVEDALSVVAGYCIGLDMTVRGPEERSLRKSVDSFSVLGPWLVTADEYPVDRPAQLSLSVNGVVRQSASTADLILSVADLIAFASSFYTLWPGDILLTGTPEGVGPVQAGDVITASIDHIGSMTVQVRAGQ